MKAKITSRAISALQKIITGNTVDSIGKALSPYRSGPDLVAFFNEFGANESYSFGGGFPSRWAYVEEHLSKLNDTDRLPSVLEAPVDPAHYLGTDFPVSAAVEHLNQYLAFDDLELVAAGKKYRLRNRAEPLVAVETKLRPEQHASHEFIGEQIEKCDRKLRDEDYDGAITNARSALEAVLTDIESRLDPAPPAYDGDLAKLYKRVQKHLNLDPDRPDIRFTFRSRQQRLQRRSRIAPAPMLRVHRVPDLDHARRVRRPVVAGAAHGHLPALVPDDTGHPRRAGRVLSNLLVPHPPHVPPLRAGEVGRQWHRAHRVRGSQVTVVQGAKHRRSHVHDAHIPLRARLDLLVSRHPASMPHGHTASGFRHGCALTRDMRFWLGCT